MKMAMNEESKTFHSCNKSAPEDRERKVDLRWQCRLQKPISSGTAPQKSLLTRPPVLLGSRILFQREGRSEDYEHLFEAVHSMFVLRCIVKRGQDYTTGDLGYGTHYISTAEMS